MKHEQDATFLSIFRKQQKKNFLEMKMTKEKIIIRVGNRLRITLRKYNIYVKDNIREKR